MPNLQKISLVLLGFTLLSCLGLAGLGVWWVTNAGGANVLAAMTASTSTAVPSTTPTPEPQATQEGANPVNVNRRGLPIGGVFGIVSAVNGSSITVSGARGTLRSLTIGSGTQVIVVGVSNATVGDIKPGFKILVLGSRSDTDEFEPRAVVAAPAEYTRANVVVGKLQSVSGQGLTLQTASGALTVLLGSDTRIYNQLLLPARASDLVVGRYVIVIGQRQSTGTLTADLVLARTGAIVQQPVLSPSSSTPFPTP